MLSSEQTQNIYPSVNNCGRGSNIREALQGVPRLPSENSDIAQGVIDRGYYRLPKPKGWDAIAPLKAITGTGT